MRITIDQDMCIGSGACVLEAPEVFAQDPDGLVVLLDDQPPAHLEPGARQASLVCPAAVITITE